MIRIHIAPGDALSILEALDAVEAEASLEGLELTVQSGEGDARNVLRQFGYEPLEVVDADGIAHGYTDEDDTIHGD